LSDSIVHVAVLLLFPMEDIVTSPAAGATLSGCSKSDLRAFVFGVVNTSLFKSVSHDWQLTAIPEQVPEHAELPRLVKKVLQPPTLA
jgi:hypothetical protein